MPQRPKGENPSPTPFIQALVVQGGRPGFSRNQLVSSLRFSQARSEPQIPPVNEEDKWVNSNIYC